MSSPAPASVGPPQEARAGLLTLVSPYVGLVRRTLPGMVAPSDGPIASVACDLARTERLIGVAVDATCGATKPSRGAAFTAAVGEAVERYSASFVPERELVTATAQELGDTAVGPERFRLFREDQFEPGFPFERFTPSTRISWVRGFSLADGEPWWLPAQLVYLSAPIADEPPIGQSTSSGLACGPTYHDAALTALLELLERDAFQIAWHSRLTLTRLGVGLDPDLSELAFHLTRSTRTTLHVLDLTPLSDAPAALALARGSERDPVALAVGAACAPTASGAWTHAVCEAFATRAWARSLVRLRPDRTFAPGFDDVATFEDHVHLYALREHARYADFLDASEQGRDVGDIADLAGRTARERLAALSDRLRDAKVTAYLVDVTPPDVAAAGLRTVRALSPDLVPLDALHAARSLGLPRLYTEAWRRGLRPTPLSPSEIAPYPHPFP